MRRLASCAIGQARFWELASGALLFECHARAARRGAPSIGRPLAVPVAVLLDVSVATALGLAFAFTTPRLFPLPFALLAVGATLGVIALGAPPPRRVPLRTPVGRVSLRLPLTTALLSSRPLVYLGKASYPLYLWHWP